MAKHSRELQVALDAVKHGAKIALSYYNKPLLIKQKADKSVVTQADHKTEQGMIAFIRAKIPGANFVAEESGGKLVDNTFIIDPIDGTRSFTRNIPSWCILLAYWKNSEVRVGICFFPVLNLLFFAEKDCGAFCNDKEVKVSDVSKLSEGLISLGSLTRFTNKNVMMELIDAPLACRAPDPTYAHALIASGQFDAIVDTYGLLHDIAPFARIIPEAGGTITNLQGKPWTPKNHGAISSNGRIHEEILKIVNGRL